MQRILPKLGLTIFGLFLGLLFIELLSTVIVFFYQTRQEFANTKSFKTKHDITILALGESTTQGGEEPWPGQLEKILNKKNLDHSFSVINDGQGGITTDKILRNLEYNLNKYHPDIVISMMGINDAKNGAPVFTDYPNNSEQSKTIWENLRLIKLIKYLLSQTTSVAFADETQNLIDQGRVLLLKGELDQAAKIINQLPKTLETESQYLFERDFYIAARRYKDILELAKQAQKLWPDKYMVYVHLGDGYRNTGEIENALKYYNQALKMSSSDSSLYSAIGILYKEDLKDYEKSSYYFQKAIDIVEKLVSNNPNDAIALSELENLYRFQNQSQKAEKISKKILGINSATSINYQTLKRILKDREIKLIAVQYPTRSVQSLKDILGNEDVIYVDNEISFKQAVEKAGYDKYFIDHFGGDFGHATKEGNFLLASNIAKIVNEIVRLKK